ncbi:SDR family oxidoreductase [Marinibactrum halimedae]|uniref:NmrA family transcriptional regulator n=1 Tax=Marinibactrum halimedae TaxID=1444977 RepID=A0AA37WND1_9GAMM|nr:SDR family oxidoreductase [Marinibactrum halimedae]MCD9461159.1 SDR family oxidoreductase [Marinibactrum halimedae]GLS26046.1 NmrA family transcriptional regulator [Marinibactrum halimedae]
MTSILVTGGTGNNGKAVLESLAAKDVNVRALLRNPSKAIVKDPNISYVKGDFSDSASLEKVLSGIEVAFLVSAYEPTFAEKHGNFVRAAEKAGVRHIVQLSGVGADLKSPIKTLAWLGQAEAHLRSSTLNWTILRPATYTNNFFASAQSIKESDLIAAPFGTDANAVMTLVDNNDIGEAAANVLLNPDKHIGNVYTLTGSEQLNHDNVASVFSEVLGRPIKYLPVTNEEAKAGLLNWQVPEVLADSLVQLWTAMRNGEFKPEPTQDLSNLIGRAPTTFEQFVRANVAAFKA